MVRYDSQSSTIIAIHHLEPVDCEEGAIRLAGGKIDQEGRVEVCNNGVWGSICSASFDTVDGHVICKDLGYKSKNQYNHQL